MPFTQCQALVRFFALRRIKPHTPPLVRAPVNSFEFQYLPHLASIVYGQDYRGI